MKLPNWEKPTTATRQVGKTYVCQKCGKKRTLLERWTRLCDECKKPSKKYRTR